MTKQKYADLLDTLGIKVNEGVQNDVDANTYPRLVYWEFVWDSMVASGEEYDTKVTYQTSFFSQMPRDPKLIELKNKLNELGLFPIISHEYIKEDRHFHSYFAIELLENV